MKITEKERSRFFSKVLNRENLEACWIWNAYKDKRGYGRFWHKNKQYVSSRFSYLIHYPYVNNHLNILHKCNNPPCVNPKHLYAGTQKDNGRDMVMCGRSPRGERNGQSTLKTQDIKSIRKMAGKYSYSQLASMFSCSVPHINDIIKRYRWPHID